MTKFIFESELSGDPAPHNQSNFNRFGKVYKSNKEKAYIQELEYRLRAEIIKDKAFEKYGEVPIRADYIFGFAPTKSWSKKKIQRAKLRNIYMNFRKHIMLRQKLLQQVEGRRNE